MTKIKIIVSLIAISLLAASCNPFAKTPQAGVVKTTNGGVDWQFINKYTAPDGKSSSLSGATIGPIRFAPKNKKHVYAASYNSGVFKSEDSGENWTKILSNVQIYDIAIDPDDENRIYAAGLVGTNGRVLKTEDGGKSWNDVFTESTAQNIVRAMDYNPKSPKELLIGLQNGTIIRSPDGGGNWELMHSFDDRVQTMNWHENGNVYVLLRKKGLQISSDGGRTFSNATAQVSDREDTSGFRESVGNYFQFAVAGTNADVLYVGTDRGLFKSTDGGGNWKKLGIPAKEETGVRGVALGNQSDSVLYASSGYTLYKSTDGGQTFQTASVATNGFINYIVVDPELPQVAFAGIVIQ